MVLNPFLSIDWTKEKKLGTLISHNVITNCTIPYLFLQGWTQAPGRNAQLEYRLSIYHARVNDTGTYTCTTPTGKRHTMKVEVKNVRPNDDKHPLTSLP